MPSSSSRNDVLASTIPAYEICAAPSPDVFFDVYAAAITSLSTLATIAFAS